MALNLLAAAAQEAYPSTTFVVLLGIGVVFLGLICIIVLCMFISMILNKSKSGSAAPIVPAAPAAPIVSATPAAPVAAQIPDKQAFVAAVSAAIAEELGTDVSALRIISIKQL